MLNLEFDVQGIREIVDALGATPKQVKFALNRAAQRTAATLRKKSEQGFKSELDIKRIGYLRKRLKSIKLKNADIEGAALWYGLNPLPLSMLKGSVRNNRPRGASWSGKAGNFSFKHGFVHSGLNGRGKSIYYREGKARLPLHEASAPIKDKMDVFIEDVIFDDVEKVFMAHFVRDLSARVRFGIGMDNYRQFS